MFLSSLQFLLLVAKQANLLFYNSQNSLGHHFDNNVVRGSVDKTEKYDMFSWGVSFNLYSVIQLLGSVTYTTGKKTREFTLASIFPLMFWHAWNDNKQLDFIDSFPFLLCDQKIYLVLL